VLLPNLSTTVAVVLGLTAAGRACAMLNYSSGAEAMRAACVAAGVKTLITSKRFVQVARLDAGVMAESGLRVIYLEALRERLTLRDKLWLVARALPRPRSVIVEHDPAATAIVLFTSGSEARAKGVAISHDAMLANMAQMRAVIDFGPNDKYLNALPMYHTYGLIACTLMPLIAGTRLLLYTTPLHYKAIPELAYARDCTYVFGTSTFLAHYARQAHPYDFHHVRVVVSGGEKLDPEVARLWMKKFGLRVMEGYGATECGPAMSLNTPLCYREGTVGRFLPGIEWRIVNVPGIARGGVLHVRAPNLMSGYYFFEQPGLLHPPRSEVGVGWYNTGDVVEVDGDGFVTILGRVKRFAKIAGEMVSLELVERIAYVASVEYKHAATVEQVSGHGESTVLFTTDPRLDRLTLVKAARSLGAKELAVPRRIVKVGSLPLLGSGKTDYVTLGAMGQRSPSAWGTSE
jgi:acyl-[acyl-carrier-protein]-phospholipid O-acyltransferase/long-chain-fatty-acid--[acyl-carrier-protein] ligase